MKIVFRRLGAATAEPNVKSIRNYELLISLNILSENTN
ncbi:hypothetical protein Cal6303_1387 [Calothrix sp. PCC 6303]|nr:hypothetical protein Cal6303_1387 [Calothrix sp. PCC 6303]